jgi:hypothetical protein
MGKQQIQACRKNQYCIRQILNWFVAKSFVAYAPKNRHFFGSWVHNNNDKQLQQKPSTYATKL